MGNIFQNTQAFLIQTLFNIYIIILLLRIILQWAGAQFYNPVSQFVIKVTNPLIIPFRKFTPVWHGIDFATIAVLLIVEMIKIVLLVLISTGQLMDIPGLLLLCFADILSLVISIYFFVVIIVVILSWVHPRYNPVIEIIYLIAEPILRPARRILPPISGFDFSPILVLVLLKLIDIVLVSSLVQVGLALG